MASHLKGKDNPNWKGGRTVDPRGYVLLRVGVDHHLSDVRGYAYEHRIIAEQMIGRRLLPDEEVHHDDENKSNNSPDNLIVAGNSHEHMVFHRSPGSKLRMPGEDNPLISCACGCAAQFMKYDGLGRPRNFISGHNVIDRDADGTFKEQANGR